MKVGSVKVGLKSRSMKGRIKDRPAGPEVQAGRRALTKGEQYKGQAEDGALFMPVLC